MASSLSLVASLNVEKEKSSSLSLPYFGLYLAKERPAFAPKPKTCRQAQEAQYS